MGCPFWKMGDPLKIEIEAACIYIEASSEVALLSVGTTSYSGQSCRTLAL